MRSLTFVPKEWLHGEGLKLPVEMVYDTALARDAYSLAERWDASRNEDDLSKLSFQESDVTSFNANQKGTYPCFSPTLLYP